MYKLFGCGKLWRSVCLSVCITPALLSVANSLCAAGAPDARRTVAMALPSGAVFLGWRYLESDGTGCRYRVFRAEGTQGGAFEEIAAVGQSMGTNFTDPGTLAGKTYRYYVATPAGNSDTVRVRTSAEGSGGCIVIPTRTDSSFLKLTVGDLDGDGRFEYVLHQPNSHKDPWNYRIPDGIEPVDGKDDGPFTLQEDNPFKVEAYNLDGELVWSHRLGAGVERGIWYSPMTVWDLDGDGRAEVIVKDVEGNAINCLPSDGSEHLVVLNPATGEELTRTRWPDWLAVAAPGIDVETYNDASRNLLGIAYLDGENPAIIVQRGTYNGVRTTAFNGQDLSVLWDRKWSTFHNPQLAVMRIPGEPFGKGAHGLAVADFDNDGKDEVLVGSTCLDNTGSVLWGSLSPDHPDICIVGDILPGVPGVEVFLGMERSYYTGEHPGLILADCAGKVLWSFTGTKHVHGTGWAGLVSASSTDWLLSAREQGNPRAWIVQGEGKVLYRDDEARKKPYGLPLFWGERLIRQLAVDGRIVDWDSGRELGRYEGKVVCIADVLGDWREELITRRGNAIHIYTSTIPASLRKRSLMEDRQYSLAVARSAMGYYIQPTESPAWWGRR